MFQNSYQNGGYFDFFDPKANPDKLKPIMKTANLPATCKVFDKDLKIFVIEALTPNEKIQFHRQLRLMIDGIIPRTIFLGLSSLLGSNLLISFLSMIPGILLGLRRPSSIFVQKFEDMS